MPVWRLPMRCLAGRRRSTLDWSLPTNQTVETTMSRTPPEANEDSPEILWTQNIDRGKFDWWSTQTQRIYTVVPPIGAIHPSSFQDYEQNVSHIITPKYKHYL